MAMETIVLVKKIFKPRRLADMSLMKLSEIPKSIIVDNFCPATEDVRAACDKPGGAERTAQICWESLVDAATCSFRL